MTKVNKAERIHLYLGAASAGLVPIDSQTTSHSPPVSVFLVTQLPVRNITHLVYLLLRDTERLGVVDVVIECT